jgi:hypothetical protein
MKKILLALAVLVLFSSHDMYLKLDSFFLAPNAEASILLYNGTFDNSDNVIDRDRMLDASLVGNESRLPIDTADWREDDDVTILDFTTGEAGTWVAGVSTRARSIEMEAKAFNDYLAHDGVQDMLASRKQQGQLQESANERYSKHVKAIFQVGDKKTSDWKTVLGYPIEFIPLANPYLLQVGGVLQLQLLLNGQPLANQIVSIDSDGGAHQHDHEHAGEHEHEHGDDEHSHGDALQLRTDAEGIFTVNVTNDGQWFLRTIHMVENQEEGLTHESNWATLTFEVAHGHEHSTAEKAHTHADGTTHVHEGDSHTHAEEGGIPTFAYWLGSLLLIGGLFWYFNRQQA